MRKTIHHKYARLSSIAVALLGLLTTTSAAGQTLEVDLGIDLSNPEFQREFNASFETGLTAGAPAMNHRESVLLSVVAEMYQEDTNAAIDFVQEELRREERRLRNDQRRAGTPEMDFVYSANVEYALGQLYQLIKNRSAAERYYLQAIEKYPSYVAAYIRLMEIYLVQEDCDKALAAGKQAVDIGGVNGTVFRGFGLCYYLQEDFGAALTAFRLAKAFLPGEDAISYYQALSALNTGNYDESTAVLSELIRKHPDRSSYYFIQVNAYLENDKPDSALQTLEIARRKGMLNSGGFSLLGNIYINKDMPEAAAQAYISGMEIDRGPDFDVIESQFTNLARFDDWSLADEFLTVSANTYEGRLSSGNRESLEVMQAQVLIGLGQSSDGADLLLQLLESNPTNGEALLSLARYYRQQQDFERADIFFQRAAKEQAVALSALIDNAQMAADRANWLLAIELLTAARDIAPAESLSILDQNLSALERVAELER
jgi:tetratricopeptide (TPR) repeat protein